MAKLLKTLCKELEFNSEDEYFDYIIESLYNGNRTQVRELFNDMKKDDQRRFLNEMIGYNPMENEVRLICIEELTN